MASILGTDIGISAPSINIGGVLSNSWIYFVIIGLIGLIFIVGLVVILFLNTYNRKIEFYENISGKGYARTKVTRARVIRLGRAGEEVLKTLAGGIYLSSYGRKMGKNTYWYAKGQDGYWYNITLGDLDDKFRILDIEPVDRDVRMYHLGIDKIAKQDYGEKKNFIEKYGMHMAMFLFLIIMLVGLFAIAGEIKKGLQGLSNAQASELTKETAEILNNVANKLDAIKRNVPIDSGSGLVPANDVEGG